MGDQSRQNLKNVMVLALADGQLSDEEKAYIDQLRRSLGIDEDEFRRLVDQVRESPKSIVMPSDPAAAADAVRLLAELAAADGQIGDLEQRVVRRAGRRAGMGEAAVESMLAQIAAAGGSDHDFDARVDEIYARFAEWDDGVRGEKVAALGSAGRTAVVPLLRILESYRAPNGAPDAFALKVLVVEQLGRLADTRAVYYLAQQVNLGDVDDEITCAALRCAAAGAIGKLVGEPFTPDQTGVNAARQWWLTAGYARYNALVL